MQIKIVAAPTQETKKGAKNVYTMLEIVYENMYDNRVGKKKLLSFKYPETFSALRAAAIGDIYNIVSEKIGDYWEWTSAGKADAASTAVDTPQAAAASAPARSSSSSSGHWETTEERAARQVLIVKQSSLANAIAFNKTKDINALLNTAQQFTDWVLNTNPFVMDVDREEDDNIE